MGLYHLRLATFLSTLICLLTAGVGCTPNSATPTMITVSITSDGHTRSILLPPGATVQRAIDTAGLTLNTLDRTDPPLFTVLAEGDSIQVIRVTESFKVEQEAIPFESQIVKNESLSLDQEMLIQKGKNGLREITYRRVFEDGVETSDQPTPVNSVVVEEPVPEIRMVGVQAPFVSIAIPGRLFYLRDGNLWMIEGTTADRRAVLTTGDLDGRVLSISADGAWLLFTRTSSDEEQINGLWVVNLNEALASAEGETPDMIDLKVADVVHYAGFSPISDTRILFSTVEPRSAAPGWQANNDLEALTYSQTGWTTKWTTLIEANSGGVYGWWGTHFEWSPDGEQLAYARPDSIGHVDFDTGTFTTTVQITPLQTRGDWAWVPGITWGPDSSILYSVDHVAQPGSSAPEQSQSFDLVAIPQIPGLVVHMVSQVGMFAYPLASPFQTFETGELDYQIAYLQALFPDQSETSRYRLAVMDRDGSNRRVLFPSDEAAGLEPQEHWGSWSPEALPDSRSFALAVLYQGNLWLIDVGDGTAVQVTGDGLTSRVIWTNLPTFTTGNP